jgi:hypothetical protein
LLAKSICHFGEYVENDYGDYKAHGSLLLKFGARGFYRNLSLCYSQAAPVSNLSAFVSPRYCWQSQLRLALLNTNINGLDQISKLKNISVKTLYLLKEILDYAFALNSVGFGLAPTIDLRPCLSLGPRLGVVAFLAKALQLGARDKHALDVMRAADLAHGLDMVNGDVRHGFALLRALGVFAPIKAVGVHRPFLCEPPSVRPLPRLSHHFMNLF